MTELKLELIIFFGCLAVAFIICGLATLGAMIIFWALPPKPVIVIVTRIALAIGIIGYGVLRLMLWKLK